MNIVLYKLSELYQIIDVRLCATIISYIIFSYIDLRIFMLLFKIEIDKKTKLKAIFSMSILKILSIILIPNPYCVPVNVLIGVLIFKFFMKKNIEKCVLAETINSIITISGKAIIHKCCVLIGINNYQSIIYNYMYDALFSVGMCIWVIIIYFIIKKSKVQINLSDDISKKSKVSIMIISIIGCTIIHFNVAEMTMFISDFPYIIFLLDVVALVICFCTGISDVVRLNELEKKNIRIQCLENYNNTLSIMYDSMREFKHDFSNFVQALDGYVNTENIDGIKKMTKSILKDCRSVNNMEILDPAIINNPAIYSIITNKYYLGKQQGINMNIEVMVNINEINIPTYDLCKILGILLDNAIEAAIECEEKIVNIRFVKDYRCNRKLIIIENTYNKVDIDVDKIFEKGYSTKTNNNNEHGLGLWTIRKMLQQSKNLNLFTIKEQLFKQQLEIY